jgi:hypothetical protein
MAIRWKTSALSPAQQALALRARFPGGKVKIRPTILVWTGDIQPTPLSSIYTVQITHRVGRLPRVVVVDSPLDGRPGEPLPHFYREGSLCLHLRNEWNPGMFIVETILPWTSEWLAHYEIWKATGDWHGGGEPPAQRGPAVIKDETVPPANEDATVRAWHQSR